MSIFNVDFTSGGHPRLPQSVTARRLVLTLTLAGAMASCASVPGENTPATAMEPSPRLSVELDQPPEAALDLAPVEEGAYLELPLPRVLQDHELGALALARQGEEGTVEFPLAQVAAPDSPSPGIYLAIDALTAFLPQALAPKVKVARVLPEGGALPLPRSPKPSPAPAVSRTEDRPAPGNGVAAVNPKPVQPAKPATSPKASAGTVAKAPAATKDQKVAVAAKPQGKITATQAPGPLATPKDLSRNKIPGDSPSDTPTTGQWVDVKAGSTDEPLTQVPQGQQTVLTQTGERVQVELEGRGWVYTGVTGKNDNLVFLGKTLGTSGDVFSFRLDKPDQVGLRFRRTELQSGLTEEQRVNLVAATAKDSQNPGLQSGSPAGFLGQTLSPEAFVALQTPRDKTEVLALARSGQAHAVRPELEQLLGTVDSGIDEILYHLASAWETDGVHRDFKKAYQLYLQVFREYPWGPWAAKAEDRARYLKRTYRLD